MKELKKVDVEWCDYHIEFENDSDLKSSLISKSDDSIVVAVNIIDGVDLFDEEISIDFQKKVLQLCSENPENRYLFCSQNPQRYVDIINEYENNLDNHVMPPYSYFGMKVRDKQAAMNMNKIVDELYSKIPLFIYADQEYENIEYLSDLKKICWIIFDAIKDKPKNDSFEISLVENIIKEYISHTNIFTHENLRKTVKNEYIIKEFPW